MTSKQKTFNKPIVVAMIGLVGSGKSSVARELAKRIDATIISGDNIRVKLRKNGERYKKSRTSAENETIKIVKHGGNVILDSDFVDDKKRASIREKTHKDGARLVFIRIHCDLDVMVGRIITATYHNRA